MGTDEIFNENFENFSNIFYCYINIKVFLSKEDIQRVNISPVS